MSLQRRTHWIVGMKRSIWQEQLFTFNESCRINERCCRGFPWSRCHVSCSDWTLHTPLLQPAHPTCLFKWKLNDGRSSTLTTSWASICSTTSQQKPLHHSTDSFGFGPSAERVQSCHRWNTWGRGYCWRSDLEFHPGIPGMTERFSLFLLLSTDFSSFSNFNNTSVFFFCRIKASQTCILSTDQQGHRF